MFRRRCLVALKSVSLQQVPSWALFCGLYGFTPWEIKSWLNKQDGGRTITWLRGKFCGSKWVLFSCINYVAFVARAPWKTAELGMQHSVILKCMLVSVTTEFFALWPLFPLKRQKRKKKTECLWGKNPPPNPTGNQSVSPSTFLLNSFLVMLRHHFFFFFLLLPNLVWFQDLIWCKVHSKRTIISPVTQH